MTSHISAPFQFMTIIHKIGSQFLTTQIDIIALINKELIICLS